MEEPSNSSGAESDGGSVAPAQFVIQSEQPTLQAIKPEYCSWSPKLDLLCFVTIKNFVIVYRLNGQRVWMSLPGGPKNKINDLKWRPDGMMSRCAYDFVIDINIF